MRKGSLIPTISLAGGIAFSAVCSLSWWWGISAIASAIIIYIYLLKASKDPVVSFRIGKWHIVWVVLLFSGIGMTDDALNRPITLDKAFYGNIPDSLHCVVTSILSKTYGERIDVVLNGTNGAKARIISGVTELSPGDKIIIPSKNLNYISGDTTEISQKIQPMLKAAGILYSGRINPKGIIVTGKSSDLRYSFIRLREKIEISIENSHLKKSTSNFLNVILMGDKAGLDENTRLTFANGGMAHVLALSGLHIGILAGFLILIMGPIKMAGKYKWGYFIVIIVLWFYVAVTGMAYSSVRACIMTTFAFIGIITERKNFATNALCSACLLILIFDPTALFDAGFQLSMVCVGALIAFATKLNPIGHRHHPVLHYICGMLLATMVATAASWVLTSYYFSQIPLMFLPTNVILLPILPFYLSIAVVFIILLTIGIQVEWLGHVLDHGYESLLKSIEWLSCGTDSVIEYQIPLWGVVLWLLMLASCAYAINKKET